MANEGFKGTRMGISSVSISGSQAQVEVQFVDDEGFVHATTRHALPIGEHDDLRETADAFLTALSDHINKIHFTNPSLSANHLETAHGIAEALRSGSTENPDGFEESS